MSEAGLSITTKRLPREGLKASLEGEKSDGKSGVPGQVLDSGPPRQAASSVCSKAQCPMALGYLQLVEAMDLCPGPPWKVL